MAELAASPAHPHAPAHQFEDVEQQHEAATLGMWAFLATEVMFFGGLITGFAVYRFTSPGTFAAASRHLSAWLGGINTAVLLGSSLTMALAVRAGQVGDRTGQVRHLVLTMLLGGAFLGIKAVEYTQEYREHLVPGLDFRAAEVRLPAGATGLDRRRAELFFVFYFFMTGLHALHLVIGIGLVGVIAALARRGRFTPEYHTPLELTGLYWHFIDIVWVFLYPLLYLIDIHR
jgi:cytochrome c oxidase subunit 3